MSMITQKDNSYVHKCCKCKKGKTENATEWNPKHEEGRLCPTAEVEEELMFFIK